MGRALLEGTTVAPQGDSLLPPSGWALLLAMLSCCVAASALVRIVCSSRHRAATRRPLVAPPEAEPDPGPHHSDPGPDPDPPPQPEVHQVQPHPEPPRLLEPQRRAHLRAYRTGARFIRLSA